MEHYIDIKLEPDAEMRENVLLNKVYTKFHKGLSSIKSKDIGISFPKYKVKLGNMIRIHSSEMRLIELQKTNWLGGLVGYCKVSPISLIPSTVSYRKVSRKQSNMTQSKLRRLIKRRSISREEIKLYRSKMFKHGLDYPYLELESTSNEHMHRRYIIFGELVKNAVSGEFDQFGLSKVATIPWF